MPMRLLDRHFKMKIYPGVHLFVVHMVVMAFTGLLFSLACFRVTEAAGPRIKNSAGTVEGNQLDGTK